jgi:protease-4
MVRQALRYGTRAYWAASEIVLHLLGRRSPYGLLKLEVAGELSEEPPESRLLGWPRRRGDDYFNLLALLRWAREDPQLRGVLIRCGELRAGWAKVQELRRNLVALRDAGKHVWMYCAHAGLPEYVLASAAEQIVLAPAGTLDVAGLSSEVTFVSGGLKKLGIEAELIQMGKYKSAAETFTRSDMSPAHREMMESLVHDLYEQVVAAVAAGRGFDADQARAVLDRGPFVGREAQQERLVDALLYEDEAEERLRAQCDNGATIGAKDYFARRRRAARRAALRRGHRTIGLLTLSGTVKMGDSVPGLEAARACGAESAARDLQVLRERSDVAAVVLRIASPGGSGLASDLIWHEVMRTRQRKPVVVSFGDVAASGGYYIGVAGSPVIAEAGTITGSIGVLAGKALLRGLYDHLGVTKEIVSRGRHAAMYSDYLPLGEEERQRLQTEAEFFYSDFVAKVAAGRHLSGQAVAAAAEGRVWTGRQAQALGLIDQLGGLERALDEAKVLAGCAADDLIAVERYPRPRRFWNPPGSLHPPRAQLASWLPWLESLTGDVERLVGAVRPLSIGSICGVPARWESAASQSRTPRERVWAILPFRIRFF